MKKLLLLGGSAQQIPAIKYAKDAGYFTVLCDYLPDNPGQYVADKFYQESTTNKEAVLKIAKEEKIDGIVAYASDPAAPVAAFVAENLGLPTNPYSSVTILSEKHLFRQFLKEHGFNVPCAESFTGFSEEIAASVKDFKFPVMVKPVDSSGSKGITRIDSINELEKAYNYALKYSRNKIIVVEEYIQKDHDFLVGGDIFVINGKVEFWGLLNCHRDQKVNPLVPVGKSFPLKLSDARVNKIKIEIQKLMDSLDIKFGAFNVELMFNDEDKLFFIEMGPRNGGNMIPDLLSMISGKDLIAATVECAVGNFCVDVRFDDSNLYFATHNLHLDRDGVYKNIEFSPQLEKYIVRKSLYKKTGDTVYYFEEASKALGIIFMKFNSVHEMNEMLENIYEHIDIQLLK